ncbi:MAG: DNA polymerase III subunit beta [bacterium]
MEFTCEKKDLQSGVSVVEKIVTTRSTLPIIGNMLFEAGKDSVKISANNLEMGIEIKIKAKVTKEGSVLIPAKTLSGFVAKLPNEKVMFKLSEKGIIRISYGSSHFNIHTLPPDEFPVLPKIKAGKSFRVNAQIFALMIKQTIFSASTSEEKYVLTGVLLETGKSQLTGDNSNFRLVATDGYRLAKRGESIKDVDGKVSIIIPARALQELLRIFNTDDAEEAEVVITISDDQVTFKYKDVYLVSRLIQGQFPDYKQVIPKKSITQVQVSVKSLLESAERSAIIASGSANIVRFEIKNKKLHLAASTPDVGTIDESLEAEIKGEEKNQVAFNIRLITDMLKVIGTSNVMIELTSALGPGVIKEDGPGDYLYIVMPIRTQEAG